MESAMSGKGRMMNERVTKGEIIPERIPLVLLLRIPRHAYAVTSADERLVLRMGI